MADYKTYVCDRCGEHDAKRINFGIGYEDDPADGHRSTVYEHADLCPVHMAQILQLLVSEQVMEKQCSMRKTIVNGR